ncbi:MAG: ShlB/FhaC/HecB family hemolysin secretion/activation protein [Hoeflea sp.]|uniref:ShlB/FhaC/HecB family hemolysin secretion/activation protein n=1 Tax=Hoeflea sp. TaxID=1940281 RepID=UPI003EF318C7
MLHRDEFRRRLVRYFLTGSILAPLALMSPAGAIERHPAPEPVGSKTSRLPGDGPLADGGDTAPLGVNLKGIVIETSTGASGSSASGVVVNSDNPLLNSSEFKAELARYVGKPLSQALISSIRNDIVRYMRANDRPLIAVIVPPQEVTTGTLTLVVMPFVVGEKTVERIPTEHERTDEQYVLDNVRTGPGDDVVASELIEDLNWLNKNPFRNVGVIFKQGRLTGTTDLTLTLKDDKPWSAFAGYSNGGTKATGYNRLFAGGVRELPNDALVSYQFTASPEAIYSDGALFSFNGERAYMSHSAGYFVPLANRHTLSVTGSYVRTRARLTTPFVQDTAVWEGKAEYAVPVSAMGPASEVFFGIEAKHQNSGLVFSGTPLGANEIEIYQGILGLRGYTASNGHQLSYQVQGVVSPGGLTSGNSDAAFAMASGNAGDKSRYAYLNGILDYRLPLPAEWNAQFSVGGQLASGSLPGLAKYSVGGDSSVRGYETNELNGDNGLLLQGEVHLPVLRHSPEELPIQIFAFADYGLIHNYASSSTSSIFGAGVGVSVKVTRNLSASAAWGHAFMAGATTGANSDRFHVGLLATF